MIKRPLVWILGAYLCGLLLTWYRFPGRFLLLLFLISCILIYLMLYRSDQRYVCRKDGFLWTLPAVFVLGCLSMGERMKLPAPEQAFAEEAKVILTGEVTDVVEKQKYRVLYLHNNTVTIAGEYYPVENIMVYCSDSQKFRFGNQVTVTGSIQKFSVPTNPGQFNERMYYRIQNIDYKVMAEEICITNSDCKVFPQLLEGIKQRLQNIYVRILPEREAGALTAMLLGDKFLLDEELEKLYQENGISHILAISGLHISLIGITLYSLLRKLKAGLWTATFVSISIIFCYGMLTDFSVSTNRAVVMFTILLLARVFGKTYDMLSALAFSAFLILLDNPLQLFSAGFLLSFGAVLGIALLLPCMKDLIKQPSSVVYGVLVSISAQLMTLPMILYYFYQLPVYSVFVNLIILPFTSALVLSALAAGIIGCFCLPAGVFLIGGAGYILKFYEWVCKLGSRLPGYLYTTGRPGGLRIFIYVILMAVFLLSSGKYRKKRLLLLPVSAVLLLLLPFPNAGLSMTMLEVGQGEAIFLENETGTTYLVDGGSSDIGKVGTYRLQPFLLSRGTDCIDYAFVTHADQDHCNGLIELLQGSRIRIKHMVLPRLELDSIRDPYQSKDRKSAADAYLSLVQIAEAKNIEVLYMNAGDQLADGKLTVQCLHPAAGFQFLSDNSYSSVLSISYGEFDLLLTGDLERDGEKLVMKRLLAARQGMEDGLPADYEVLKIAHHGSRNSTYEDFLELIQPDYALISCGKKNRYGHPHEELLDRLNRIGSESLITSERGAITIVTDGKAMKISETKKIP